MTEQQQKFLEMDIPTFTQTFLQGGLMTPVVIDEALCELPRYRDLAKEIETEGEALIDKIADFEGENYEKCRARLVDMRCKIVDKMFRSTLMYGLKMRDLTPFAYYLKLGFIDRALAMLSDEEFELDQVIAKFLGHAA